MINVSRAITDSRLSQEFKVIRCSGTTWLKGRPQNTEKILTKSGVISVSSDEDLEMIPEADRTKESITIHTISELKITNGETLGDKIKYHNKLYKISALGDKSEYGYYKAIATLLGDLDE